MADGGATAEKLRVGDGLTCTCTSCTFIRNAYMCHCPHCGRGWQAAFATAEAATEAMARHTQECLAGLARRQAEALGLKRRKRPKGPRHYPVRCGWCGEAWPQRFTTQTAARRFLRTHVRACYRREERGKG